MYYKNLDEAGFTSFFLPEEPKGIGSSKDCRCPQPNCSQDRKKKEAKCVKIKRVHDGFVFKCHHCGWGDGVKIGDGSEEYRPHNYLQNSQPTYTKAAQPKRTYTRPAKVEPVSAYSAPFTAFFKNRGIGIGTLQKCGVGETRHYFGEIKGEALAAQFPIEYDSELYAYKYRCLTTKTFAITKDSELVLIGSNALTQARKEGRKVGTLYIVEGEIDLLSLYEFGIIDGVQNIAVSVPNGTNSLNCLQKHIENGDLQNIAQIAILSDGDAAGVKMREEVARRVGRERCLFAQYPDGCKDANDVLMKYGADGAGFIKLYFAPLDGIKTLDDEYDNVWAIRENGYEVYKKIGIKALDEYFTWSLGGQLTVLSAPPNSAKTDFLFNVALRLAHYHDAKIGIMSPEAGDTAEIYDALIKMYVGMLTSHKDPMARSGVVGVMSDELFMAAQVFIREHIYIYACKADIDTNDFLEKGKLMVARYGVNMLICDPYNHLSDAYESKEPKKGQMQSTYLNNNLQKIRSWGDENSVHVVLVPHPKALAVNERMSDYGQINGGAAWGNKAYNVIFLNRLFPNVGSQERMDFAQKFGKDAENDRLGDYVEVVIRKFKKRYAGRTGELKIAYDKYTGAFGDCADDLSGAAGEFMTIYTNRYDAKVHN
jgi:twinkle protein